jgi:repressor LexA
VHRTCEARSGQIVVARLDDEVTVKRFRRRGRDIVLMPENGDFAPIVVDAETTSFTIEGLAVGLLRNVSRW